MFLLALKIEVSKRGEGVWLVAPEGDVVLHNCDELGEELQDVVGQATAGVVVSLEGVDFIDSKGLGVLLGAWKRAREQDITFAVTCSGGSVLNALRMIHLDSLIHVYSSVPDALIGVRATLDETVIVRDSSNEFIDQWCLEMTVPAREEMSEILRLTVASLVRQLHLSIDDLYGLRSAVHEAFINAVQHAEVGEVYVKFEVDGHSLIIEIRDEGCGMESSVVSDFLSNADGVVTPELLTSGLKKMDEPSLGLGIRFMHDAVDDLSIDSHLQGGTAVKLVKKLC